MYKLIHHIYIYSKRICLYPYMYETYIIINIYYKSIIDTHRRPGQLGLRLVFHFLFHGLSFMFLAPSI